MANPQSDYLTVYKTFFEEFAATVSPDDQLPVKVGGYCVCESEIVGEIVDWILQYLCQKRCPSNLVAPLTQTVLSEVRLAIKKQPYAFGFRRDDNAYQPLKLMQVVTSKVNDVCLRYLNPECLESLSPPTVRHMVSACAVKNSRRRMEDRHTIIDDFHSIFDIKDQGLTNYYAIFDGHAGTDAAVYGVSHLHQFLAESQYYPSDPEQALRDAFERTDAMFLDKSNRENLRSGTTALCALIRHKEQMLHVAWLGDSQALLVRRGVPTQLVVPHKPDRQDERERIEGMGGCVMYWGTWRVNGQLAVSRAIGDLEYKPYVTATPDIVSVPLEDNQDFLILACDGLWDYVSEQEAIVSVYQTIREHPGDLEAVSQGLVQLSKQQGSVDNISVIVVFLTDPARLADMDLWPQLEEAAPAPNGALLLEGLKLAAPTPSETDLYFLNRPSNGKDEEDEDFGPETDVDAVDDVLLSPTIAAAKAAAVAAAKAAAAVHHSRPDLEVDVRAFDPCRQPRDETPTPPADDVSSGPALVPDSENVAESGEESEDEWNYYRVEPAEKSEPQQPPPPAVSAGETNEEEEDEASMESRLNPNAAEFVPSPTASKPSMEELLSFSPHKGGVAMDDVRMPSPHEFQEEVCLRPSELSTLGEVSENVLPDLLNGKTELSSEERNPYQILDNVSDGGELMEPINPFKSSDHLFDKSEVSSTKAEFGDETAASFLANMSGGDFLLNAAADSNNSGCVDLDASMTEADFVAANLPQEESGEEVTKPQNPFASAMDAFEQNVCFEVENEFVPSVESEGYQIPNEDVNVTPLNQELGEVDFTVGFTPDVTKPLQENVADVVLETQDVLFSNSALSPNNDVSGLISDFTKDLVAPTLSPVPLLDFQESSISTGVQNIDLDMNISNPVQLETEPISPVQVEPFTPEVKDVVNVVEQNVVEEVVNLLEQNVVEEVVNVLEQNIVEDIQTSSQPSEAPMVEEVPSSQENAITSNSESVKEVVELQLEETKHENQQQEEVPKADDSNLLSGIADQPEVVIAAASVVTAAVVGTVLAKSESTETKDSTKKPVADKTKSSTKATPGSKSGTTTQKSQPKTPTSPTKPLTPMSRTAPAPKKTATSTSTTRAASKPTTTTTSTRVSAPSKSAPSSSVTSKVSATSTSQVRVKVASSPTKAVPPVKAPPTKTASLTKPRPTPLAATKAPVGEKKPSVTNGDAKPLNKRPETLATKKLVSSTTAKPLSRPATAPVASKSTTRTVTSARTAPVSTAASKPAVNGIAKPKSTTTTTSVRAKPLSAAAKTGTLDKQVKDSANKQISSTGTKLRTATATTTRKSPGGITKTTTTTTVTKSSPGKKPSATTVTKTSEIITVTPGEVVVVEGFTTTVTKDDSPIIDNAQIEEISSTD